MRLARRFAQSRDLDDNRLLATAHAEQADCLITNDRDLLDLPEEFQATLAFTTQFPQAFLATYEQP